MECENHFDCLNLCYWHRIDICKYTLICFFIEHERTLQNLCYIFCLILFFYLYIGLFFYILNKIKLSNFYEATTMVTSMNDQNMFLSHCYGCFHCICIFYFFSRPFMNCTAVNYNQLTDFD